MHIYPFRFCFLRLSSSVQLFRWGEWLHVRGRDAVKPAEQAEVFGLERLEFVVELVVPRVEDEDLEGQGRGGDAEVGEGDEAGEYHLEGCL